MGFIKMLIGLPLLVVILVFAFVNNDLAVFNLWPFYIEITVSLSVPLSFLSFSVSFSASCFLGCRMLRYAKHCVLNANRIENSAKSSKNWLRKWKTSMRTLNLTRNRRSKLPNPV